jgi:hypothetical protein
MTRKRLPGQERKRGPKTIFTNEQLKNVTLLSQLGATNDQIAIFFGVHSDTIQNWEKHQEYKQARIEGGLFADMKVVASLYQRAIGFDYEEAEAIRTKSGDFITKITKKKVLPDVKAQIYWLGTRQRENWTSTQSMNHNHSGKIEHIHNRLEDIPIQELSPKAQDLLFEITQKQLSNGDRDN